MAGNRPNRANDAADDIVVERLSPDEAFEVVGHETRLRALESLNEADGPLAFAALRRRVGADDPGGFNYHLGKLAGRFVRNTDEGYELADPGRRIVGTVLSGDTRRHSTPIPFRSRAPVRNATARWRHDFTRTASGSSVLTAGSSSPIREPRPAVRQSALARVLV